MVRNLIAHDRDERLDRLSVSFLTSLASFFIWVLLAVIYVRFIPALSHLGTALLAGASIASVVLGLAAQSTLGNLISGISLVLYKPYRKGDRLQITAPGGFETGTVESMSLGYTALRTFDNRRVVVPNAQIASQVMVNLTAVEAKVLAAIPISIGYGDDIDHARQIVLDLARDHPQIEEVSGCPVTLLGPSSVDLTLYAWCPDAISGRMITYEMLEQIKKRFDAEGIEIPYAYQNIVLSGEIPSGGSDES